jgi:hypothetical protein
MRVGCGVELLEVFLAHSHITRGSVSLSNHKVPARPIVPRCTEGAAIPVIKINFCEVVGPILDCEPVLARFEKGLRGGTSNVSNGRADSKYKRKSSEG